MLSLVALALISRVQSNEFPESCCGLWAFPDGRVMALLPKGLNDFASPQVGQVQVSGEFTTKEGYYGGVVRLRKVPNGYYRGEWGQAQTLVVGGDLRGQYPTEASTWNGTSYRPWVPGNLASGNQGSMFVWTDEAASGKLKVELQNAQGATIEKQDLKWLGGGDRATVAGHYKDSLLDVQLEESDDKGFVKLTGSMVYNKGRSHIIDGCIRSLWGNFKLIDGDTGKIEGKGYVAWTPSRSQVLRFAANQWAHTDHVTVWFYLTDNSAPTGMQRYLMRLP